MHCSSLTHLSFCCQPFIIQEKKNQKKTTKPTNIIAYDCKPKPTSLLCSCFFLDLALGTTLFLLPHSHLAFCVLAVAPLHWHDPGASTQKFPKDQTCVLQSNQCPQILGGSLHPLVPHLFLSMLPAAGNFLSPSKGGASLTQWPIQ